jgi:hypothetical protein
MAFDQRKRRSIVLGSAAADVSLVSKGGRQGSSTLHEPYNPLTSTFACYSGLFLAARLCRTAVVERNTSCAEGDAVMLNSESPETRKTLGRLCQA